MNQNPSDSGDICIGENYKLLLSLSSSSQQPSPSSETLEKLPDKSLSNANPKDDLTKTSGDTSTKTEAEAAGVPSANIATNAPASVSGAKPTITKKEPDPPAFEKELISKLTSRFGDNKIKVIY